MPERYKQNAESLGRDFFPLEKMPGSGAGSTDMGNISHRVPSIHPMIACAPPSVVIHNPEFAKWAGSEKGDKAVIDGAKALAMTAIDVLTDKTLMQQARDEFSRTAEFSAQSWLRRGMAKAATKTATHRLAAAAAAGACAGTHQRL